MKGGRATSILAAALALGLWPGAAASESDAAVAEKLFREGEALLKEGKQKNDPTKFDKAILKFKQTIERLPAGKGTLVYLDLGDAYKLNRKTADAWRSYQQALANSDGKADRYSKEDAAAARAGLASLAADLSYLSVVVPGSSAVPGLKVLADGVEIAEGEWSSAGAESAERTAVLLVNPGRIKVDAVAEAHKPWTTIREVPSGARAAVVISGLERDSGPSGGPSPERDDPPKGPTTTAGTGVIPAPDPKPTAAPGLLSSPLRMASVVSGGAGIAGLVTASILSGVALVKRDASADHCGKSGVNVICNDVTAFEQRRLASDLAFAATFVWAVGGAATAAGAVLWVVGGPEAQGPRRAGLLPVVAAAPGGAYLGLQGRF